MLDPSTRLGLYEILAPLGAGGMGEVYQARDTKLGRDVAIKVLPEHFAADKERMARFEREARVLASLNHPNIAAVYGLEESDGFHYLVMELVPGESLAAKIQKRPLPVAEVLAIARQLIDALEAAHENGVIHRDLKPANIQVTPDGHVKVLDFGLAKVEVGGASSVETSLSPTMTRDATRAGIILGTAPYMSPEQARGLPVDKRSDIFSFGCVVFEMLTGRKAFEGELVSDVMASVIKSEAKWSLLPRSASRLRKLLGRCLEKDPQKRLRDIGDARVELDEAARAPADVVDADMTLISRRRALVLAAVSSLLVAVVIGLLVWRWAPSSGVRGNVTRFRIEVTGRGGLALSPDGRAIAHTPGDGIQVRFLDSWESRALPGIENLRARAPFFSPDGESLGFINLDDIGLYKTRIEGGTPVRVSDLPEFWTDSSWTENGTILLSAAGGIWEVDETGGSLRPLVSLPEDEAANTPVMLPGGGAVLFEYIRSDGESVAICDLRSGEISTLVPFGQRPRYLPTGHILYAVASTLMAAPFDNAALALSGESVPVFDGVAVRNSRRLELLSSVVPFAVSPSGTLAYHEDTEGLISGTNTLVLVNPGEIGDAGLTVVGQQQIARDLRLSPDATRLAGHFSGGENDIWVYEFTRGTMSRLTLEPGEDETPVWSPDGNFIAFAGQRERRKVFRVRADGSVPPEPLWESDHHMHVSDWSPDGRWLLLDVDSGPRFGVWILDLEGDSDARPLLDSRFDEKLARISPDGLYFAYESNESGREEVYVQRFPELGDKRQISNEGGVQPIWSRDGRKLFYRSSTHVMAVDVSLGPPVDVSSPKPLVEDTFLNAAGAHTYYDVMPDGNLIMLQAEGGREGTYVNVVVNWFHELEARVPR